MMDTKILDWIDKQYDYMVNQITKWAMVNSYSHNLDGLSKVANMLYHDFAPLGDSCSYIDLNPVTQMELNGQRQQMNFGKAIHVVKRPDAQRQVFLAIHYDTVFPPNHHFQHVIQDYNRLIGPGVIDAKAGIVILLTALRALEQSIYAKNLGWEVLLNPDEELGSPGSSSVLTELAARHQLALVYEPCLADDSMVNVRKGSGNFTIVVHGKKAHAGREFHLGCNAIAILSEIILLLARLTDTRKDLTVNVGKVEGGGPVNVVPDLAGCRFNIRVKEPDDLEFVESFLKNMVQEFNKRKGVIVELDGGFLSPPKILDEKAGRLCQALASTASELEQSINWQATGGVCDGNKLAAAGLAVIDTMGARGGNLHSDEEFLDLTSLTEKAKLTALFLMKLANGEYDGLL